MKKPLISCDECAHVFHCANAARDSQSCEKFEAVQHQSTILGVFWLVLDEHNLPVYKLFELGIFDDFERKLIKNAYIFKGEKMYVMLLKILWFKFKFIFVRRLSIEEILLNISRKKKYKDYFKNRELITKISDKFEADAQSMLWIEKL